MVENRKLLLWDLEEELTFILCRSIIFVHDAGAGCKVGVIHDHEPLVQIKKWQNIPQVLVDRFFYDIKIGNILLLPGSGKSAVEIKPDRLLHLASAEFDLCRSAGQSNLVDHVSQNDAVAFQAVLRVRLRRLFCDCVAEGVWMTNALAFNNFEFSIVDTWRSGLVNK